MKYKINNQEYDVVIIKKNNKNTYIRVKEDMKIYVTTNYLVNKSYIKNILDNNIDYLKKMLSKRKQDQEKEESFYYLGNIYDIIYVSSIDNLEIVENKIYVKNSKELEKWYKKQIINLFQERLEINYKNFKENIP